jgi:hypothetical protein
MEALQTLEVRRVQSSEDLIRAGDYCYIRRREPIRKFETEPTLPPDGFWRSLLWFFFGKKRITKEFIEVVWPEYDAIILMCPHCSQPIGTTKDHRIVSLEPLTIEKPLACAYSRPTESAPPTIAFQIQDGKIMPA